MVLIEYIINFIQKNLQLSCTRNCLLIFLNLSNYDLGLEKLTNTSACSFNKITRNKKINENNYDF